MSNFIRVLVVDDSALMRKLVSDMLAKDPQIEVVGQARDGADALKKLESLSPDVITLDVEMPVLDGVATLEIVMRDHHIPVVMLSSLTRDGAATTLRCLELGAVDFVEKPSGSISLDIQTVGAELISKVKLAHASARAPSEHFRARTIISDRESSRVRRTTQTQQNLKVICIGASTGGPRALGKLIPKLPLNLRVPIVIVQHLPEVFTALMATRLNQESEYEVREAKEGDRLSPGVALIAPGGKHLEFDQHGVAHLSLEPSVHGVRPAVDITMRSLANHFGPQMAGVILTGMGKDGATAMRQIHDSGGFTIAEDASTCVVYGMPKAAFDLGGVDQLLPLDEIPAAIIELTKRPEPLAQPTVQWASSLRSQQ